MDYKVTMQDVNEDNFNEALANYQGDANIAHTANHVAITSLNCYEFMDYAFHGDGPFRDGRFLVPHTREMFYKSRRELAYYENYVKPICQAMYVPIFADDITRTVDPDDMLFSAFLENVDNIGTTMHEFMQDVMRLSRLHGVTFVVMENYPEDFIPPTMLDAKQTRVFPYCYIKKAQAVEDFKTDRFGNMEHITFLDEVVKEKDKCVKIYRMWTRTQSITFRKDPNDSKKNIILKTVDHNIGIVPVIPVYTTRRDDPTNVLVDPPLYDIARINHVIYNKSSEIRDLERSQGFSVLVVQDDSGGNLTVGPNNVIFVPTTATNMPQFIAPNSAILDSLVSNRDKTVDSMFRIAQQLGVVAVKQEASGVALSYKFFGHENILRDTSMAAKGTEFKIAELFKLYTSETFEYAADYPMTFQPISTMAEVDVLAKYLDEDLTQEAKTLALKKLTTVVLGDQDKDELQEVLESFDEVEEEEEDGPGTSGDTGSEDGSENEGNMGEPDDVVQPDNDDTGDSGSSSSN